MATSEFSAIDNRSWLIKVLLLVTTKTSFWAKDRIELSDFVFLAHLVAKVRIHIIYWVASSHSGLPLILVVVILSIGHYWSISLTTYAFCFYSILHWFLPDQVYWHIWMLRVQRILRMADAADYDFMLFGLELWIWDTMELAAFLPLVMRPSGLRLWAWWCAWCTGHQASWVAHR